MENLLTNPGFETGNLNSWATGSGSPQVQSTNPHTGTYGAQCTGNGTSNLTILYQLHAVEGGLEYYLATWVKNATGSGAAGCYVAWLDKDLGFISKADAYSAASTSYSKKSLVATAPANAVTGQFSLTIRSGNSATVYFDDCEFYCTNPARRSRGGFSRLGALSHARIQRVAVKG